MRKHKAVATFQFRFYASNNKYTGNGEYAAIGVAVRRSILKREIVKRGIGKPYCFTPGTSDSKNHRGYRLGCHILAKLNRFGSVV